MKIWQAAALTISVALLAFNMGHSRGLRDCPEFARHEAEESRAIDLDVARMLAEPTGRDAVCEQVFDLVDTARHREAFDEQQERSETPYRWGE